MEESVCQTVSLEENEWIPNPFKFSADYSLTPADCLDQSAGI
jgi:hypothetical protein